MRLYKGIVGYDNEFESNVIFLEWRSVIKRHLSPSLSLFASTPLFYKIIHRFLDSNLSQLKKAQSPHKKAGWLEGKTRVGGKGGKVE